jgi:hypothetical protein
LDYIREVHGKQAAVRVARDLGVWLEAFVMPLLIELDRHIDKPPVRTFLGTLQIIVQFRQSTQGLLLSELGGYLLSPDRGSAGTKRLSNLLRSQK